MIDLHYWPTPNGKKVTILLEECGLPYRIVPCSIGRGDQFKSEISSKISPNNRMPAIVDHAPADGGAPFALFESGAIMIYIAEKAGRFYSQDLRHRHAVNQWVIWQMANQGPKSGECGHFRRLGESQGDQSYAVRRFTDEVNRLFGVLNNQLYDRRFLIGEDYTIADVLFPSVRRPHRVRRFAHRRGLRNRALHPRGSRLGRSALAAAYAPKPEPDSANRA